MADCVRSLHNILVWLYVVLFVCLRGLVRLRRLTGRGWLVTVTTVDN
jgi:hypothetical protein